MPRHSVLDDRDKRNRILRALADGRPIEAAAAEVGTTKMAVLRYRKKYPDYDHAVKRAMADGERVIRGGGVALTPGVETPAPKPRAHRVTVDAEVVSEAIGLDADLVMDVDRFVASDAEIEMPPGAPRLTVRRFVDLCWARACDEGRKDAAAWARLLAPVMFGPTLSAQARIEEAKARKELEEEAIDGRPDSGMLVVEVPRNEARPHLSPAD